MNMTSAAKVVVLVAIVATGCGRTREVARDAAVTTFRVIDAPANYVRRKIDAQEGETTTTTTTTTTREAAIGSSDVVTPGRPLPPRQQGAPGMQQNAGNAAVAGATPRAPRRETANVPPPTQRTTTPPPPASTAEQFPTARPVPDKPGFVYSVDPKGGIIDVTGYKSGDKAKDPYTKQIFVVP